MNWDLVWIRLIFGIGLIVIGLVMLEIEMEYLILAAAIAVLAYVSIMSHTGKRIKLYWNDSKKR